MAGESNTNRVKPTTFRLSEEEFELLRMMGEYLHKRGKITENSISEVVRYACFKVLLPLILEDIEVRRIWMQTQM